MNSCAGKKSIQRLPDNLDAMYPWPRHPHLRPGEMLTSWLVRLAHANGSTLRTICRNLCPDRQVMREPLDRRPPDDFVRALSSRTLTPTEDILKATIWSLFPTMLTEEAPKFGHSYWVLPVSAFIRQGGGQQYCPSCLAQDATCHYPLQWRLAFVTTCLRHRRDLVDACPGCGMAKTFVGGTSHSRLASAVAVLTHCQYCGGDLRLGQNSMKPVALGNQELNAYAEKLQEQLAGALGTGSAMVPGHGLVQSNLFFLGVRQILKVILHYRRKGKLAAGVQRATGYTVPVLPWGDGNLPSHFELLNVQNRKALMGVAGWILDGWPDRFIDLVREADFPLKVLLDDSKAGLPYWYESPVRQELSAAHAPWRPDGISQADKEGSYNRLGHRALSVRLAARERRLEFIRAHPDLVQQPKDLAKAMKKAGLYSSKTQIDTITKSIGGLIDKANVQNEWWRVARISGTPLEKKEVVGSIVPLCRTTR